MKNNSNSNEILPIQTIESSRYSDDISLILLIPLLTERVPR